VKNLIEYTVKHFLKEASKVDLAVYSGSRREKGFVTLFFFSGNKPVLVAKVARSREGLENLRGEYINLGRVSHLLKGSQLEGTVETPLDLVEIDGLNVLVKRYEGGITGTRYTRNLFLRKRNSERFLSLSTDWLINFTKQSRELHLNSPDAKQRVLQEIVGGDSVPGYAGIFIKDASFFLAPTHGELLPPNILVDHKRYRVECILDFENFRMDGLPIADLMGLIVSIGTLLYGTNETAIDSMFLRKSWFLNLCSENVKKFCHEFSIDIQAFREVMPLYSDRAIELCQKWNMQGELLHLHQRLRTFLIKNKDDIFMA